MQTKNGGDKLCKLSWSLQVSSECLWTQCSSDADAKTSDITCHCIAEYIQELNMHHGLYSAVVRSLQHYDRLQSHSHATSSCHQEPSSLQVSDLSFSGSSDPNYSVTAFAASHQLLISHSGGSRESHDLSVSPLWAGSVLTWACTFSLGHWF